MPHAGPITADERSPEGILAAIAKTNMDTVVGPIAWGNGPVKNVTKTPLVGGQWKFGGEFQYDLVVTANETAPAIPVAGQMAAIA